jgi:NAD+ dependent glucose-6-phosphate dehydrogenase
LGQGTSGVGPRLLVVTGASGRIGTFYRRWLHEGGQVGQGDRQWTLRLVDVRPPEDVPAGDEVLAGPEEADLADPEVARRAVAGAAAVLHLAADPSPRADFYGSLLDRNVKAPYNVLQAAVEAQARRVILCSSINAVNGYPRERQVRASDVAFPGNIYGATKAFSEALAGAFVSLHPGFSAIAVRIGGVRHPDQMRARPAPEQTGATVRPGMNLDDARSVVVTLPDLSRLFDCCLGAGPEVTFAVVNGSSRNRHLRMDLEETRRLVGYEPQDDAFADWSPAPPAP